jgi:branched-chain amino acid transport system substrate-binding protein
MLLHFTVSNGRSPVLFSNTDTIKIGLLITDKKSSAAKNGAEMAISKANAKGGCKGNPFKLEVRSLEGPWGTGSKEAVSLIFEKEVWAIMGSHDGRNAHLAEQVTAKARVVFLSSWAADPTLSQAFLPWYFSCVPNNDQQADVLFNEIYNNKKFNKVVVLAENSYDAEFALKSFINKITASRKPNPVVVRYIDNDKDQAYTDIVDKITSSNPVCIALFGTPSSLMKIIELLNDRDINLPVYGTLSNLDENELTGKKLSVYEGFTLISSYHWFNREGIAFKDEFKKLYGVDPGTTSAYAYDGMNVLIEAVRMAAPDRERVQQAMVKTKYNGVTGTIQFDKRGNRMGPFQLMIIKDGVPVTSQ